ncbi:hypothetical protein BJ085DRAFT_41446 [Dimargaris cristalligena]|uniref:Uncharacterized protein n=1 Tax=Dimargaris cristalligena TaxID=215637 RepID=A0A4P9ZL07_9FUNG|nr:hypothetical protein BJ085DRAFT_41446 [Dimargaris cristalligena]|eukprot:RKP33262.1 hypothetical protein BJ085DRAFT_41446 [Dimargaris cristalligena]
MNDIIQSITGNPEIVPETILEQYYTTASPDIAYARRLEGTLSASAIVNDLRFRVEIKARVKTLLRILHRYFKRITDQVQVQSIPYMFRWAVKTVMEQVAAATKATATPTSDQSALVLECTRHYFFGPQLLRRECLQGDLERNSTRPTDHLRAYELVRELLVTLLSGKGPLMECYSDLLNHFWDDHRHQLDQFLHDLAQVADNVLTIDDIPEETSHQYYGKLALSGREIQSILRLVRPHIDSLCPDHSDATLRDAVERLDQSALESAKMDMVVVSFSWTNHLLQIADVPPSAIPGTPLVGQPRRPSMRAPLMYRSVFRPLANLIIQAGSIPWPVVNFSFARTDYLDPEFVLTQLLKLDLNSLLRIASHPQDPQVVSAIDRAQTALVNWRTTLVNEPTTNQQMLQFLGREINHQKRAAWLKLYEPSLIKLNHGQFKQARTALVHDIETYDRLIYQKVSQSTQWKRPLMFGAVSKLQALRLACRRVTTRSSGNQRGANSSTEREDTSDDPLPLEIPLSTALFKFKMRDLEKRQVVRSTTGLTTQQRKHLYWTIFSPLPDVYVLRLTCINHFIEPYELPIFLDEFGRTAQHILPLSSAGASVCLDSQKTISLILTDCRDDD